MAYCNISAILVSIQDKMSKEKFDNNSVCKMYGTKNSHLRAINENFTV